MPSELSERVAQNQALLTGLNGPQPPSQLQQALAGAQGLVANLGAILSDRPELAENFRRRKAEQKQNELINKRLQQQIIIDRMEALNRGIATQAGIRVDEQDLRHKQHQTGIMLEDQRFQEKLQPDIERETKAKADSSEHKAELARLETKFFKETYDEQSQQFDLKNEETQARIAHYDALALEAAERTVVANLNAQEQYLKVEALKEMKANTDFSDPLAKARYHAAVGITYKETGGDFMDVFKATDSKFGLQYEMQNRKGESPAETLNRVPELRDRASLMKEVLTGKMTPESYAIQRTLLGVFYDEIPPSLKEWTDGGSFGEGEVTWTPFADGVPNVDSPFLDIDVTKEGAKAFIAQSMQKLLVDDSFASLVLTTPEGVEEISLFYDQILERQLSNDESLRKFKESMIGALHEFHRDKLQEQQQGNLEAEFTLDIPQKDKVEALKPYGGLRFTPQPDVTKTFETPEDKLKFILEQQGGR